MHFVTEGFEFAKLKGNNRDYHTDSHLCPLTGRSSLCGLSIWFWTRETFTGIQNCNVLFD